MAIQIEPPNAHPDGPPDAVELLLDCHARIRRFCDLATRIATADAPDTHSIATISSASITQTGG